MRAAKRIMSTTRTRDGRRRPSFERILRALGLLALLAPAASAMAADENGAVVARDGKGFDEQRARFHWTLQCRGCHRSDATGSPGGAPNMAGTVARFLSVEGGREYLVRVPGVANAALDDAALAELLNWMLATFDPAHLPQEFRPYTAEEVGALRHRVLIDDAPRRRAELIRTIEDNEKNHGRARKHGGGKKQTQGGTRK